MRRFRFILCSAFIALWALPSLAMEKRDTVRTTGGDKVIISYNLSYSGDRATLRFTGQQKRLGNHSAGKYKDLSKVAVMFFDRTGSYGKDVAVLNIVPKAFMIPENVVYRKSSEGFFLVQSEPSLEFSVDGEADIVIPIYLAFKSKKGRYEIFGESEGIIVRLSPARPKQSSQRQPVMREVTSTLEVEADNALAVKVVESVNLARKLISETERLPFSDNLLDEINYLRQKKREVSDANVLSEISDVLDRYEEKKTSLEEKKILEERQAEEQRARQEAEELKAQEEAQEAERQEEAKREKKRTLWMIIGGLGIAVLGFVGNQVMQHIRNVKNQKNMMSMQQSIVEQAEAEVNRRARAAVRSQERNVVNNVKRRTTDTVRKKIQTVKVNGKSKKPSI